MFVITLILGYNIALFCLGKNPLHCLPWGC